MSVLPTKSGDRIAGGPANLSAARDADPASAMAFASLFGQAYLQQQAATAFTRSAETPAQAPSQGAGSVQSAPASSSPNGSAVSQRGSDLADAPPAATELARPISSSAQQPAETKGSADSRAGAQQAGTSAEADNAANPPAGEASAKNRPLSPEQIAIRRLQRMGKAVSGNATETAAGPSATRLPGTPNDTNAKTASGRTKGAEAPGNASDETGPKGPSPLAMQDPAALGMTGQTSDATVVATRDAKPDNPASATAAASLPGSRSTLPLSQPNLPPEAASAATARPGAGLPLEARADTGLADLQSPQQAATTLDTAISSAASAEAGTKAKAGTVPGQAQPGTPVNPTAADANTAALLGLQTAATPSARAALEAAQAQQATATRGAGSTARGAGSTTGTEGNPLNPAPATGSAGTDKALGAFATGASTATPSVPDRRPDIRSDGRGEVRDVAARPGSLEGANVAANRGVSDRNRSPALAADPVASGSSPLSGKTSESGASPVGQTNPTATTAPGGNTMAAGISLFQQVAPRDETPTVVMSTPITEPGFADEMTDTVQWVSTRGLQSVEISITPDELGPIRLKVEMKGKEAQISFEATQEQTRTLLADAVPALRENLAQSGIELRNAWVEPRGGSSDGGGSGNPSGNAAGNAFGNQAGQRDGNANGQGGNANNRVADPMNWRKDPSNPVADAAPRPRPGNALLDTFA